MKAVVSLCWLGGLLWLSIMVASARSMDDIVESGYIKVALYRDFPPYSFVENGKEKGIDVELARAFAHALDVELRLLWMTADETVEDDMRNYLWKGLNLHTNDGTRVKADVMMRVPYDRKWQLKRDDLGLPAHERVYMFAPYQTERWRVAFDATKNTEIETVAMFQYVPIGVEIDTVPQVYLSTAFGGRFRQNTKTYTSLQQAFNALNAGEVHAVMGLGGQVQWLKSQSGEPIKLSDTHFPTLGIPYWDIGVAVQADYRQLSYALEEVVIAALSDGRMQAWCLAVAIDCPLPELYQSQLTE
ncbi:amino acid ABC transporter substrate-binding protein [Vibrio sp. S9_S30]|nr:amino acid ABC transporter substrate-binding protein [Vibrio sp. S9_S30]